MRLEDLCADVNTSDFPRADEKVHPQLASVQRLRETITRSLEDDEFLLDCITHELHLIEMGRVRQGLVPFFTLAPFGINFAFGYWSPGTTTGAHEHTAWTVTAVCRNRLDVYTFDRAESYKRNELVAKNRFEAEAGRVGYIYDPCIHSPENPTKDWSLSLHVTSPRDGERTDGTEPLAALRRIPWLTAELAAHPYTAVRTARQRYDSLHLLTRILLSTKLERRRELLKSCIRMGSPSIVALIARYAPEILQEHVGAPQDRVLTRTHHALALSVLEEPDAITLCVETPGGSSKELAIGGPVRDALKYAVANQTFLVRSLPGLSEEERVALADSLVQTGLFQSFTRA